MLVRLSIILDYLDGENPVLELLDGAEEDPAFYEVRLLYAGQAGFSPRILYVVGDVSLLPQQMGRGLYFLCIQDGVSRPGTACNRIIIEAQASPEQLCADISDFISDIREWENEMNLALIDGCTEQHLLDLSERFLRNPVIIQDATFHCLASGGITVEDAIYYDLKTSGVVPLDAINKIVRRNSKKHSTQYGRFETGQPYRIGQGPTDSKEVYVDLEAGGFVIMCLHMRLSRYPFTEGLKHILGAVAAKLKKLHLLRSKSDHTIGGGSIDDYIFTHLIERTGDAEQMALSVELALGDSYMVATAQDVECRPLIQHINGIIPKARSFIYNRLLYIYIPAEPLIRSSIRYIGLQQERLRQIGEIATVSFGASGLFTRLTEIGAACVQARQAITLASRANVLALRPMAKDGACLLLYQDVALIDFVTRYCAENPVESFAPHSYVSMRNADIKNGTNNCHIAKNFIINNCNTAQTARQVYMHKNSVVYRVERMKEQHGIDFVDKQENQLFVLACIADELNRLPNTSE